jgi:hypothetical protein
MGEKVLLQLLVFAGFMQELQMCLASMGLVPDLFLVSIKTI